MTQVMRTKEGRGSLCIWLSASALSLIVLMLLTMGMLILSNSIMALWPSDIELLELRDGRRFLGVLTNSDISPEGDVRVQYRIANRELYNNADFVWLMKSEIVNHSVPEDALLLKRQENGDFHGFFAGLSGTSKSENAENRNTLLAVLHECDTRWKREGEPLKTKLAALGDAWQKVYLQGVRAEFDLGNAKNEADRNFYVNTLDLAKKREAEIKSESEAVLAQFNVVKSRFQEEKVRFLLADSKTIELPLLAIIDAVWPNSLGLAGKFHQFSVNLWNLLTQYPREANTDGGIFPALFGTALLVFVMAILAFPLGVAAGVYLREYARDNLLSRAARVAVNNLAGVPSIVYGIFGLGFFVYGLGGSIDAIFFPERVAAGITTFGTGGLIWSSLTLGLLTLPVVIVATEEALATVPSEIRQGSLALGATKFQTLWRVLIPMASPGILTGFILAMARAAGEVAPLMITGVVKSAPRLPLDSVWPFLHPERKFMHLGFHIYDMGFQSPNVEASKPLVYLTALILLALVFLLNVAAFSLRRRMRERYAMRSF